MSRIVADGLSDRAITDAGLQQQQGGTTANRPTSPQQFEFYFDTTLGKPIWHNGTDWVDATGTVV